MIILKFGGVALQSTNMRKHCIAAIKQAILQHQHVVVVVSAIGRKESPYSTDRLLTISNAFKKDPKARDLVASCGELIATAVLSAELHEAGVSNTFLQSRQTGICTEGHFGEANIVHVKTAYYEQLFKEKPCLIVPGFQGLDAKGNVMTIGRGGSDMTAVALASALQARHIEFYKDVPGIFNTDPKNTTHCRQYEALSYDQYLTLIPDDNSVLQRKAVAYAKEKAIPLYIRGIASKQKGTWIR